MASPKQTAHIVEDGGQELLDKLTGEEKKIFQRLRALILECLPRATEKKYYGLNVPFYTHNRLICFIWPPSVNWGKMKKSLEMDGVTLGFNQGYLMSNEDGILLKENRKQVYCMYFRSLKEIDEPQIRALLYEAEMIDDGFTKKKKTKSSIRKGRR